MTDVPTPVNNGPQEIIQGTPKRIALPDLTARIIKDRYFAARRATMLDVREYWINYAFLRNRQWLKWDDRNKNFVPWMRPNNRYQATINKLTPALNTIIGRGMKEQLSFNVPPNTADDQSIGGSLIAEAILQDKIIKAGWEDKREEALWAAETGGTVAIAVEWDAAGSWTGQPDTVETVLPISEFVLEPGAKSHRNARYWMKAQVLPPEQVQALYKLQYEPQADDNTGGPYSQQLLYNGDLNVQVRGTLVLTYYERPNFLNPSGAIAVVVNDQLVAPVKPWPFPFKDRLNLAIIRGRVVPGRWQGETDLTAARPIQIQYNFVQSNIYEHIKKIGTTKLAVPYGASDVLDQWDDDPGVPVRYPDTAQPPHYIQAPNAPGYLMQELENLETAIGDILGVHAVSQGQAPANLESGYGLSLLAEQDATPTGRLIGETSRTWGEVATMVLMLYADRVKARRKTTVYSTHQPSHTVEWMGSDIADQTTALVPPDALIPRSRAASQQFAENAAKMGLIKDLPTLLEVGEVSRREDVLWRLNPDIMMARWENEQMADGTSLIPATFDNHSTHIQQHNNFRKTPKYRGMSKKEQTRIDHHIIAHQRMAEEQMGAQVAKTAFHPALGATPTADEAPQIPPQALGMQLPGMSQPGAPGNDGDEAAPPMPEGAPANPPMEGIQ